MTTIRTFTCGLLFLLVSTASTLAQTEPATSRAADQRPAAPSSTITVALTPKGVRFTALGDVKQLRLEVFAADGTARADSGFLPGNVYDWAVADKQAQLADGIYQLVVTIRDLAGHLSLKQCEVTVQSGQVTLSLGASEQAGAAAADRTLAAAPAVADTAMTLTAHNGREGALVATRGALTFRVGDFFSGMDREQMRLTEEGNVGIGTTKPRARLDVAGDIRATGLLRVKGVEFSDGTSLVTAGGTAQRLDATGSVVPAATGAGTQNRLAKWLDNAGALGDSQITETASGFVGLGTASPDSLVNVQGAIPAFLGRLLTVRTTGANNGFGLMLDATGTGNNNLGLSVNGVLKGGFAFDVGRQFLGFVNSVTGGQDFALRLNADGSLSYNDGSVFPAPELFRITKLGNMGIGTASPQARLEVVGSLKLTGAGTGITFGDGTTMTTAATGGGGGVSGSGTTSTLPLWAGATTLGNSALTQTGNNISVGGDLTATGTISGGNVVAKYQDVAEWVPGRGHLPAGTVVSLDGARRNGVVAAHRAYDTHVAGVVSAQPGVILGEGGADKVLVATTGRVKVKVDATRGAIKIGDLLVASTRAGVAMRSRPVRAGRALMHRPGTIIGKALEPLAKGGGEILVLLSLQ